MVVFWNAFIHYFLLSRAQDILPARGNVLLKEKKEGNAKETRKINGNTVNSEVKG